MDVKKLIKQNWVLILILILAFVLRFVVFVKTLNQPLWWDEADYASAALHWAIGAPSALASMREVVVPFIWSLLYRMYSGEFLWRLSQFFVSFVLVISTYFCGKELFDKKIGLIAAFFMACNSLILFYTGRLLTYIWSPLFLTLIIIFFYKGYVKKQGTKYLIYSMLLFSFGVMIYWTVFLAIPIILCFLLITDKFKFIKDKSLWISTIGLIPLILYFIISKIKIGIIHPRLSQIASQVTQNTFRSPQIYFQKFPYFFSWWWIFFFVFGLLTIFKLFIYFNLIIKGESNKTERSKLLVFLWFLFILGFFCIIYSLKGAPYWETFLFPMFPAFGLISALGFTTLTNFGSKYLNKKLIFVILLIFLLIAGSSQIIDAKKKVEYNLDSFKELADAGIWLKQNSNPSDVIFSKSYPQITYYSQRTVLIIPEEEEIFMEKIKEGNYFVLSPYHLLPSWTFALPGKYPDLLTLVHVVPYRKDLAQPMVLIYKIQNENN